MKSLLITGEMRSGTTFLANFLNSQKEMFVYADMLVSLFMEAHILKIQDINAELTEKQKNILFSNLIQDGKLRGIDFSVINRHYTKSWIHIFEQALIVMQNESGFQPTLVGVKRTREENYISQLMASGVKVIYCYRDPRDVLFSASNRFSAFNLFRTARFWKESIYKAMQWRSHENFLFLKYEDLILKKEETCLKLSEFLKMTVTADVNELKFGLDKKYTDNSSFGDVKELFDTTAVYRWKKKAESEEVALADTIFQREIEMLGYDRNPTPNIKLSKRIVAAYKSYHRKQHIKSSLKKVVGKWL